MSARPPKKAQRRRDGPPKASPLARLGNGLSVLVGAGVALVVVLIAFGVFLLADGGDDDGGTNAGDGIAEETPGGEAVTAEALGQEVTAVYLEMLDELGSLIRNAPPVSAVSDDVEELREEYVDRFVDIGWRVNELDEAERLEAQFTYESALFNLTPEQQQALGWYQPALTQYQGTDAEFATLVEDFSLLPRYAFFDQLRLLDPAEADRLGVPE